MDPIADMLTSIRNALVLQHPMVKVPFSDLKYKIVKILEKNGFVEKAEKKGRKTKRFIEITLKYDNKNSVISGIKRVSSPGQRIYIRSTQMRKIKGGYGTAIISTSRGLMTGKEARKQKLGGEVICEIW